MDENTFVDRVSALRTAGVPSSIKNNNSKNSEQMTACLTHLVTEEENFVPQLGPVDYKLPQPTVNIYKGFDSDVKQCIQPDTSKSFLDELQDEFRQTVYDSYWNQRVGRVADPTPMLPKGMDPMTTLFGKPTPSGITAGELVNPPKCYVDVMEESKVGHEIYKRTHNDYDPGEQTDRNYLAPYREDLVYGKPTPCDPQGGCVRKVMNEDVNEKIFVSKILADHRTRSRDLVGKVSAPNNNIECVPKGHAFGRLIKRDALGAGELLKECPPNLDKVDLLEELCHVNTLRQQISHRHPSPLRDVMDQLRQLDVQNSKLLPLDVVYKVLFKFMIFPDKNLFEGLMCRLHILGENGTVTYEKLLNVLNVNTEFPDITKIYDVPNEHLNFETTNQRAFKYHCSGEMENSKDVPRAGIPPEPHVDILGIVSPNLFSNYGLSPKDFLISRKPEYLRTLLQRIGCHLDDNAFCKIWDLAKDQKGCVSVHTFFNALRKFK